VEQEFVSCALKKVPVDGIDFRMGLYKEVWYVEAFFGGADWAGVGGKFMGVIRGEIVPIGRSLAVAALI